MFVCMYLMYILKDSAHQKQLVKIATEVLNAFHFNLNAEEEGLEEKEKAHRMKINGVINNYLLPKLSGTLSGKKKGRR